MNDERQSGGETGDLLDLGLAFYGTITASISHELNNVVSIIDQTTGLLEDMIAAVERGKPINADRLEEIAGSLRKQTVRGLEIIRRMNAFAHSSDVPERPYDIEEAASNLVELSRRLADMKRVELNLECDSDIPEVYGNPFFTRQIIFEPIRLALTRAQAGDRINIQVGTGETDGAAEVCVGVAGHCFSREQLLTASFNDLLKKAGATVSVEENDDRVICRFTFTGEP